MNSLRGWCLRFTGLFGKERKDREFAEELESHLQMHIEENLRAGMSPAEARRKALIKLGGIEQTKEKYRERRGLPFIESFLQDVRFGVRMLRKNPGFSVMAIMTLALGIGANTAIFSVVNAVLLRPRFSPQADRIVSLHETVPGFNLGVPFSAPDYRAFAEHQHTFEMMAIYRNKYFELSGNGTAERAAAARISATLFPLLGVEPMLGRDFTIEEDQTGRRLAVLSYGLWRARYGADPNIIGRTIELDRNPYTVVGVMPKSFQFPLHGPKFNSDPAELWVPMGFTSAELESWGQMYNHSVLGLPKPGRTMKQARSDTTSTMEQVKELYPAKQKIVASYFGASAELYENEVVGDVRKPLLVLLGAVGLVLLIACANVANLLLVRASVRQKEMATRVALGAGRSRLVRQVLSESLLLGLAAGAIGVLIAFWGVDALLSLAPVDLPRLQAVGIDDRVVAFAFALSIFTACIFGLVPGLAVSATNPHELLQEGEFGATASRGRSGAQSALIVSQMAVAVTLLIGAGLLLRSFERLLETNPGFQPQRILTMTLPLPYPAYSDPNDIRTFFREMLLKTGTLSGVISAGASTDLPLSSREHDYVLIEGRDSHNLPEATQSWVLGDYFATMGIPLKRGRLFNPEDRLGTPHVVVISETAARAYWPGQDPIGKRMSFSDGWHTVIGIVGDVKDSTIQDAAAPHTYTPYLQVSDHFLQTESFSEIRTLDLALRTQEDPMSVASEARRELNSLDPALGIADVKTAEASIHESLAPQRFNLLLLGLFSAVAVFLAGIGVYGVLSYRITQRSHEIGVRIALGARPRDVQMLVLRTGALLTGLGTAIGVVAALALGRVLASMLYEVKATDPITFVSVILILLGAALLASYIPARRATRVDPMIALRHE